MLATTGDHVVAVGPNTVRRLARELPTEFHLPHSEDDAGGFRALADRIIGDVAAVLGDRVQHGPGVAVVAGPGLHDLTDGQLTALLHGLAVLLGRPMAQNRDGDLLVSVRDERPADTNAARGYSTNDRMLMHTDAADVAGLLCLSQSASGGASLLVSAAAVHDALNDEDPALLHEYYRLWEWHLRGLQAPGTPATQTSPIFSCYRGELSCRYGSSMLREGAAQAGGRSTDDQLTALDLFEDVAMRPGLVLRHTLRRGESVWMNNCRVLHGREAFEDGHRADQVRHLMRTWIWLHKRPRVAPAFAAFDDRIVGHDRP